MDWVRTIQDGCRVYNSGEYEIVESYEGGFYLNCHGCYLAEGKRIKELKEYAKEHKRFN